MFSILTRSSTSTRRPKEDKPSVDDDAKKEDDNNLDDHSLINFSDQLLSLIFTQMHITDRIRSRRVCQRWLNLIVHDITEVAIISWKKVRTGRIPISPLNTIYTCDTGLVSWMTAIAVVQLLKSSLERFAFLNDHMRTGRDNRNDKKFDDIQLASLSTLSQVLRNQYQCPRLKALELAVDFEQSVEVFETFFKDDFTPKLHEIHFTPAKDLFAEIKWPSSQRNLQSISCGHNDWQYLDATSFCSRNPQLAEFRMQGCSQDDYEAILRMMKDNLQSLQVTYWPRFLDYDCPLVINGIANQLHSITIELLKDGQLDNLDRLIMLNNLELIVKGDIYNGVGRIVDHLPWLKELTLNNDQCPVQDTSVFLNYFDKISEMKSLYKLCIVWDRAQYFIEHFPRMSPLPSLRVLDFFHYDAYLNDKHARTMFKHLSRLFPNLKVLRINCRVQDFESLVDCIDKWIYLNELLVNLNRSHIAEFDLLLGDLCRSRMILFTLVSSARFDEDSTVFMDPLENESVGPKLNAKLDEKIEPIV